MQSPSSGPYRGPSPEDRVLVLGAHPDDETLAAGGLILRARGLGAAVRVVLATDGDNAPWIQRVFERRLSIGTADRARFGKLRRAETLAAMQDLGLGPADVRFLGFEDQGITPALSSGGREVLAALERELASFRPTLVVSPAMADLHPDHSALAVLLRIALDRLGPGLPRPRVLEVQVHARGAAVAQGAPVVLELTAEERGRKHAAILRYASQLSVHRRRYLAHGRERESFSLPLGPTEGAPHHPVRATELDRGTLQIDLVPHAVVGAWGAPEVLLCASVADGSLRVARAAPQRLPRSEPRRAGARSRVEVGPELLDGAQRLFVKLVRPHGFFDEAGWLELALPERTVVLQPQPPSSAHRPLRICAIVPCYDVVGLCGPVVRATARFADWVLAIDDGSRDGTGDELRRVAAESGGKVRVLTSAQNGGKGHALLRGMREALQACPCDVIVTLDGDGQHDPAYVPALAATCGAGADLAIGAREDLLAMPLRSRFGNVVTRGLLHRLYPAAPADTQSGFRAHSRRFAREIVLGIEGSRYETEMRILLLALRRRRRIVSVPIPTVYLDGNRASHFQPLVDSARICSVMLSHALSRGARSGPQAVPATLAEPELGPARTQAERVSVPARETPGSRQRRAGR